MIENETNTLEEGAPEKVLYSDIDRVINERKPEQIMVLLPKAIAWEEWELLNVLLPAYVEEVVEYNELIAELGPEDMIPPEPVQPELDLAYRRHYYSEVYNPYDATKHVLVEYELSYDDELYILTRTPILEVKPEEEVIAVNQRAAKALRTEVVDSDIEALGAVWQVGPEDRESIKETIELHNYLELAEDVTQDWILKDNSVRPTSASELKQVLVAYGMRKKEVYEAYMLWRSQGMLDPFEF